MRPHFQVQDNHCSSNNLGQMRRNQAGMYPMSKGKEKLRMARTRGPTGQIATEAKCYCL